MLHVGKGCLGYQRMALYVDGSGAIPVFRSRSFDAVEDEEGSVVYEHYRVGMGGGRGGWGERRTDRYRGNELHRGSVTKSPTAAVRTLS